LRRRRCRHRRPAGRLDALALDPCRPLRSTALAFGVIELQLALLQRGQRLAPPVSGVVETGGDGKSVGTFALACLRLGLDRRPLQRDALAIFGGADAIADAHRAGSRCGFRLARRSGPPRRSPARSRHRQQRQRQPA